MAKKNSDAEKNVKELPDQEIPVAVFRQIHHMPLVWHRECEFQIDDISRNLTLNNGGWHEIKNPLRALSENRDKPDPEAFNEVVYFHDFARDFLYPANKKPAFRLFEKRKPGRITATFDNKGGTHEFSIERLTLHVFRTKIAILTVETLHKPGEKQLTLSQVQTIIDRFRRSYTPFWIDGCPAMVPSKLCLSDGTKSEDQKQDNMITFFEQNRETGADAPLLEPWASWLKPLNQKDWRDPCDERVPAMSFILLKKTETTNRDTLNRVRESDWYRLAEADESGHKYAYNPAFLAHLEGRFFYDRFMPDAKMPDYLATRHIFGGAHYSVVSVEDNFSRDIIQSHFRRHYEKMALTVQFEFATLLAFSSRITKAVKSLEGDSTSTKIRNKFRKDILNIHEEFLEFTHRYHFTGISGQIQAGEMFDYWRASLKLDRLYCDVKEEITSASEYAQAVRADAKAADANALAWVAILVGALVSGQSLNEFSLFQNLNRFLVELLMGWGWKGVETYIQFFAPILIFLAFGGLMFWLLRRQGSRS